jgi:hypothetical protein
MHVMSTQILVDLPDDTYKRVVSIARLTGRAVEEIIATTVTLSLDPIDTISTDETSIETLSDHEVLALTEFQMDTVQDQRLSGLLNKQQAGTLTQDENAELLALMQTYQTGLLRKAQALAEAVRRGLRSGLES